MANAVEMAGDTAAAASALAGLLLVFLGAISAAFDSYERTEQGAVRARYQRRAWFAFGGFALAILATGLALGGKWLQIEWAATMAIICVGLSLIATLVAALFSALEIR